MDYVSVEEARDKPGLKLVLTAGVPGPWGEAAKAILHVKGLPYLPVRQDAGQENAELRAWTGRDNAPIAICEGEPARDGWADILALAERLAPEPRLVPEEPTESARMFGLAHLICGPGGFAWERRVGMLAPVLALGDRVPEGVRRMASKYGSSAEAAEGSARRVAAILRHLAGELEAQRDRGSRYFVGSALTAVDLYWATFAALLEPLPADQCPMPEGLRGSYQLSDPAVRDPRDAVLLEHRDLIYAEHLTLPLDF
jgi:glutathione S-transferase